MLKKETIYRDAKIMWIVSIVFAISLIMTTYFSDILAKNIFGHTCLLFFFFVVAYINVMFIFYSIATIQTGWELKNDYPKTKSNRIQAFSKFLDDPFKDKAIFNQVIGVVIAITIIMAIADFLSSIFETKINLFLLIINVIPLLETMLSALFTLFCMHYNWVLSDFINNKGLKEKNNSNKIH